MTTSIETLPSMPIIGTGYPEGVSTLRSLAQMVSLIYAVYSQMAQHDREEVNALEKSYRMSSLESADLKRSLGNWTFAAATLGCGVFLVSLGREANNQKFLQFCSERMPDLFRILNAPKEANMHNIDSLNSLKTNQMQDKNNQVQADSNGKDQFTQILQAEMQRVRSAASSN